MYVEILFGGFVIIEDIERRFNVLWNLMMGWFDIIVSNFCENFLSEEDKVKEI